MNRQLSTNNRIISLILALACALQILLPVTAEDWGLTTGAALGESVLGDSTLGESTLGASAILGISVSPTAVYQYVSNQSELQAAIDAALAGTKDNYIYITNDFTISTTINVIFDQPGQMNDTIYLMGEKSTTKTLTSSGVRHFNMSGTTGTIVIEYVKLDGNSGLGGITTSVTNLTLDGVDIENCSGANGAGLYSSSTSGTVTLDYSTISNNGSSTNGYNGGGIYITGGNLEINGGTISDNRVTDTANYGGGIYFNGGGTLTLNENAAVNNNHAKYGAGIYAANSSTIIMNDTSSISGNQGNNSGNTSTGSGAGIYTGTNSNVTIQDDATLSSNHSWAEGMGGGIYAGSGTNITIQDNAKFVGNTANNSGGGVYLPTSGYILIKDNARFSDNVGDGNNGGAGYGGGMYASGSATIDILDNAVISGNQVQQANGGGAIYIASLSNLYVATNVLFEYNVTLTGYYMTSASDILIHDAHIFNSTRSINANSPSGDFTYLYNNYDVYYRSGTTTSALTTYTVTFNPNGGTTDVTSKKVALISTYGTLPVPTKAGYVFGGWYTVQNADDADPPSGTLITESTVVGSGGAGFTGNHTLYAYWKSPTYTVTYNLDGSIHGTEAVTQGGYATDPTSAVPSNPGYTLDGWYTSPSYTASSKWDFSTDTVTSDITLYAQWKAIAQVKVTFAVNGGDALITPAEVYVTPTLTYGENSGYASGVLPTPTRAGYTFDGWYTAATGGTQVLPGTTVSLATDHVLYAHWTPASLTVSFNANGGSSTPGSMTVTYGAPYGSTLPTTAGTKYGYTFGGWCTANNSSGTNGESSTLISSGTTVTIGTDHTLYAYWVPISGILVTFIANDGTGTTTAVGPTPTSITVTYDSPYGTLASISRSGYTFDGWYTAASGGTLVTSTTPSVSNASDHNLYAHWTGNTILVTFDPNGGSVSPTTQAVVFDQRYDVNGTLPTPTRSGYTFDNWYTTSGTLVTSASYVTTPNDHTLVAYWNGSGINVIYDVNGGDPLTPGSKTVTYNDYYGTLPTPTRTGYTFDGWYTAASGGTQVTAATQVTATSNHNIFAHWTPKSNIEVTFNVNGGDSVSPTRIWVTYDAQYGTLATAARKGYTFVEWNTATDGSGTAITAASIVNNENAHTLYAKWQINSYTMSYDSGGGSPVSSESVIYDTLATEPAAPTQPGYSFDGWYTDTTYTTQWDFSTDIMPDSGVTLYAKWTALPPVFTSYPDKSLNFNTAYTWLDEVTAVDYTGGPAATNIIITSIIDNLTGGSLSTTTLLDTSTAGSYTVTYSVTNPLGVTTTVSRTIQVGRSAPGGGFYPEINANDAYLSHNESYTWMTDVEAVDVDDTPHDITGDVGVTNITDIYGNTLTGSTLTTGSPNKYLVEYTVSDSNGNVTVATRYITVGDKDGNQDSNGNDTYKPWIVAPNAYLSLNDSYALMDEIQAWDHEDGNITNNGTLTITEVKNIKGEVVASSAFTTAERNLWTVSYEVTDSDNNKAVATRIIKVGDKDGKKDSSGNDTYLPWIIAPDKYLALGAVYTWLTDVEAYDLDDVPHDLTGEVYVIKVTDIYGNVMSGMSRSGITPLDTSVPNKYTVEYQVTDGSGNTVKESRLIKVGELDGNTDSNGNATYKPWIVAENVNVELNSSYTLRDEVTAWDPEDDELTSSIVITGVRNFRGQSVPESEYTTAEYGKWYVDYQVTDSDGNVTEKTRYIGVGDIGVNGDMIPWIIAPDHEMELGDNYGLMTDVEGWDVEDGEITSKVTVIKLQGANGKSVDISSFSAWTPNIWTVTYELTDSAGNTRQYSRVISSAESDGKGGHIPWIVAPDKTRKTHETYGIMQEIEAWDLEDGNITDKVKIVKVLFFNTEVSRSHYKSTGAGSWVITYEVTDSDGNTVQATRFIEQPSSDSNTSGDNKVVTNPTTYTPKASAGAGETGTDGSSTGSVAGEKDDLVPDTDIEDNDLDGDESSTVPEKDNPSTGDLTPIGIVAVVAICSLCVLMFMIIKKRKSKKQK